MHFSGEGIYSDTFLKFGMMIQQVVGFSKTTCYKLAQPLAVGSTILILNDILLLRQRR